MTLRGTRNGLGNEELNQPGSIVSSIWLTGSILTDSSISGASLHSTGVITGKNAELTGSAVINDKVAATAAIGSPVTTNVAIQAGSINIGAGSAAWVVFGEPFANTPKVTACYSDLALGSPAGLMTVCGSLVNTGSVYLMGGTPSKIVDWIAVG